MSWCLGRGGLGSSETCLHPSDTGSPSSFLCSGMIGRLPLTRFGVISQGCSVGGEPQKQVRHYFFQSFNFHCVYFIVTNSFAHCLVQLRDGPSLKVGTRNALRRPSSTRRRSRILAIQWTRELLPSIALVQNRLPLSCSYFSFCMISACFVPLIISSALVPCTQSNFLLWFVPLLKGGNLLVTYSCLGGVPIFWLTPI